jgi:class 3 adenylate cyclase
LQNGCWQTDAVNARTGYAKAPDGAHLAYSISGTGPIDALYVASGTISIDSWDDEPHAARYYRRLGAFLRLVRYDMRGVGLSDPLGHRSPETIEGMAGDAYAVLDAVGAEQVALLAEDGGAAVALELAAAHPDRFSALMVVNGYACLVADDDSPNGIPRPIVESFLTQNTDPDERWDLDGADDLALMAPSLQHDLALRDWWTRSSRRGASPATARALVTVSSLADARARLPEVRARTLVMHSRGNRFIPPELGRYLAARIFGARYVELASADCVPWGDTADAVVDEIEEFLTGQRSGTVDRVLATVLFTDIVDSTGRAAALGDRDWRSLLDAHDAIVRRELGRYGGREVNTTGDGFVGAFDSPTQAVQAGRAIVAAAAASGIAIRVGIHTGECERRGDDLAGLAVHIAARVAAAAGPGEVFVSRTVRDLVGGSEARFADRGEHELKGVPERWQLFAVES